MLTTTMVLSSLPYSVHFGRRAEDAEQAMQARLRSGDSRPVGNGQPVVRAPSIASSQASGADAIRRAAARLKAVAHR